MQGRGRARGLATQHGICAPGPSPQNCSRCWPTTFVGGMSAAALKMQTMRLHIHNSMIQIDQSTFATHVALACFPTNSSRLHVRTSSQPPPLSPANTLADPPLRALTRLCSSVLSLSRRCSPALLLPPGHPRITERRHLQVAPGLPDPGQQGAGRLGGAHTQRHAQHGGGWLPPKAALTWCSLPTTQAALAS